MLLFHLGGEVTGRGGRTLVWAASDAGLLRTLGNGDRGVRLFFVLSGFVLALPFARSLLLLPGGRAVSLRKFYLRRLTRLEPPYLAALLLIGAVLAVWGHGAVAPGFAAHWAASAVYLHGLIYHGASTIDPVAWSLEVEIQFYLLAPLCMQVFRVRPAWLRRVLLLAFTAACGVAQVHYLWFTGWVGGTLIFYIQYFAMGLFLADLYVLEANTHLRANLLWDVAAALAMVYAVASPDESREGHLVLPFVFSVVVLAAFSGPLTRRLLSWTPVAVIGGMCYSIYLLHFPLIAVVFKVTRRFDRFATTREDFLVQIVATLVPVVLLCMVFYVLVERPCMDPDWPSHLVRRLTGRRHSEADALDSGGIS